MAITNKLKGLTNFLYPTFSLNNRFLLRSKCGLMNYCLVNSWWGLQPLQRLIRAQKFTFDWRDQSGYFKVKLPAGDYTQLWVVHEIFSSKNYNLSRVPFEPDIILDLGANIGLFALLVARHWPEAALVCVEPHPVTFSLLCENLKTNHVAAAKMQCAISNETAVRFMSNKGAAISEHLVDCGDSESKTLTLLLESLIPKVPDLKLLVKMDIEGAEFDVLSAVKRHLPKRCFIFVEVHEGDGSLKRITRWAQDNGFRYVMGRRAGDAIDGHLERL